MGCFNSTEKLRIAGIYSRLLTKVAPAIFAVFSGCTREKEIIRYAELPGVVRLAYPPADSLIAAANPTFAWHPLEGAARYQIQVSRSSYFVAKIIDAETVDTTYTTISRIGNDTYFWRVRGQNSDGIRGDWSEAEVRILYKSDYIGCVCLISQIDTYGSPRDVHVRHNAWGIDTAFVADGQACLTLVDVSDRHSPSIIRNIDPRDDDQAKGLYLCPTDTFPYVFVADMHAGVYAIDLQDTLFVHRPKLTTSQNLEDVTGVLRPDSMYVFWLIAVSSQSQRRVIFRPVAYTPWVDPDTGTGDSYDRFLPADAMGVYADSEYAYIACGSAGLILFEIIDLYDAREISTARMPGATALSVEAKGGYAYVAADRGGFYVVDVSDKLNPVVVDQVNTAGRSQDVQVVGNYAFLADANAGLNVIDIAIPDSAHLVATYPTPYAWGLWADIDFIYLCDRDLGLMIFENRISK